jgi:hypothetical protein
LGGGRQQVKKSEQRDGDKCFHAGYRPNGFQSLWRNEAEGSGGLQFNLRVADRKVAS